MWTASPGAPLKSATCYIMACVRCRGMGPRIHELLQTAERQLEHRFPESAVVTPFTVLELCCTKIVVECHLAYCVLAL
jgi:hypothetical protein